MRYKKRFDNQSYMKFIFHIAVNGGYSEWSEWSCDCDGTETRTRTCTNPTPVNDGDTCEDQMLGEEIFVEEYQMD